MTIRLSADQSEELDTIAAVDGQPVSHVIRSAIAEHIEERKRDAAFQDMLRQRIEREQRMLPDDERSDEGAGLRASTGGNRPLPAFGLGRRFVR